MREREKERERERERERESERERKRERERFIAKKETKQKKTNVYTKLEGCS